METMASGVTVLPSTSGGGKSSDGSRQKRKIASGHQNVRKKVCLAKDVVKPEATKSAGSSKPSVTKRKDRLDDEYSGDSSPELDAARALTMFSQFIEERSPSPQKKAIAIRKESVSPLPQWSRKRRRSSRARRAECSSEDSHTNSEPPVEQQSEGASSLGKDSHSAFTPVKLEAPSGSVEQGCASDTEKQNNKLLSDSSCDFNQLDSRAESPTSPLPASVRIDEVPGFAVYPKLEEGGRSAFQKVVPIRPVKKLAIARKPKVEEKSYEAGTPEQGTSKLVNRKKPKPTVAGQLPDVKTEDTDIGWALSTPAIVSNEGCTRLEDTECANATVAAEEKALPGAVLVKIESKPVVKSGQRAGGKLKPAISESEKEARRQRRVQANRESARQTIRRKQVLCEELSQKSQHLSSENDLLRQDLELKLMELKREKEISVHLKDQLAKCDEGAAGSEYASSPKENQTNGSAFKYPLPSVSFGQMPVPPMHQMPPLFWYAQAYAQAAQATGMQQAGDIALALTGEYASALSNFAMGMPPGYWVGLAQGGSQGGQTSVLPHFFAHPAVVSGASKFSPGGEETPASSKPVVSLPATQGDGSFSRVACGRDRGLASAKSVGAYRTSGFRESFTHDSKKSAVKCESACEGSAFGKANFFKLTPAATQAGIPTSCIGGVLSRQPSGEELLCVSSATAHLGRASSGNLAPHLAKMNPRFMFTNAGRRYPDMMGTELSTMMAAPKPSAANAKAAEARRRRKEVQRSRSLLHRQAARVAEHLVS